MLVHRRQPSLTARQAENATVAPSERGCLRLVRSEFLFRFASQQRPRMLRCAPAHRLAVHECLRDAAYRRVSMGAEETQGWALLVDNCASNLQVRSSALGLYKGSSQRFPISSTVFGNTSDACATDACSIRLASALGSAAYMLHDCSHAGCTQCGLWAGLPSAVSIDEELCNLRPAFLSRKQTLSTSQTSHCPQATKHASRLLCRSSPEGGTCTAAALAQFVDSNAESLRAIAVEAPLQAVAEVGAGTQGLSCNMSSVPVLLLTVWSAPGSCPPLTLTASNLVASGVLDC